ncbi:carbohydrate ABC transporter permease [Breznakiella homolactica]|uniref:Carbohydrate ABC transporter permease n=1 Tax=Breznakiella homolactica TaxID=2798577 RepID=A0A7T7XRC9_9SPIR|nr:carbohydrate ABC transporter permease [Breznakiella homolactica]QQO11032.1 carbohydrate ABC transporter permease [Breznakiella homolactica]
MSRTRTSSPKDRIGLPVKILLYFFLVFIAVVTLIPFYWMAANSLKAAGDFYAPVTSLFPERPIIENYTKLLGTTNFGRWLFNSLFVSIASLILGLGICSMAGFAFSVYKFKGKKLLFWTVLSSVAIPEIVTIIPVFSFMVNLKMIDTYSSLVLPYSVSMFGIFLMKQYIGSSLQRDLLEAARIDGIGEFGIFFRIVLPLIKPGLGVLGISLWLTSWSGYFWPLIMLKSREMMTVPLGLATLYADPWNLEYGMLMAGSLISTIPIIVIFLAAQEQFISGLTAGAVKG